MIIIITNDTDMNIKTKQQNSIDKSKRNNNKKIIINHLQFEI